MPSTNRSTLLLVVTTVAVVLGLCVLLLSSHRRVSLSPATFNQIEVGLSRDSVHEILGEPDLQIISPGYVNGPSEFVMNFSPPANQVASGKYSKHLVEQWTTSEITAIVVFDTADVVVCRYSRRGQTQTILGRLWPRERIEWPPAANANP